MNRPTFSLKLAATLTMLALLLTAGCTPETGAALASSGSLRAWLDQPPTGATLPLAPYTLKAHARQDGGGVIEIDFFVNEVPLGSVATDSGAALAYGELAWNPSAPGRYRLQAWAVNADGLKVGSAIATVCVTDANAQGCPQLASSLTHQTAPSATPAPAGAVDVKFGASPNPAYYGKDCQPAAAPVNFEAELFNAPAGAVVRLSYSLRGTNAAGDVDMPMVKDGVYLLSLDLNTPALGYLSGSAGAVDFGVLVFDAAGSSLAKTDSQTLPVLPCQPNASPVPPTDTPVPAAALAQIVSFTSDANKLVAGECTILRWSVVNAAQIALNGQLVAAQAEQQVCPTSTAAYNLLAQAAASSDYRSLQIDVILPTTAAPSDTTGPVITKPYVSPVPTIYGSCDGSVSFNAGAADPAGIASVQIWYRL
jgi:hypothetical protein